MAGEFRWTSGWEGHLARDVRAYLETDLGPRIVAEAKRTVPILTGELRSSISHGTAVENGTAVLVVAAGTGGRGKHAAFVELGTSRMRAQPYLRPAAFRRWS